MVRTTITKNRTDDDDNDNDHDDMLIAKGKRSMLDQNDTSTSTGSSSSSKTSQRQKRERDRPRLSRYEQKKKQKQRNNNNKKRQRSSSSSSSIKKDERRDKKTENNNKDNDEQHDENCIKTSSSTTTTTTTKEETIRTSHDTVTDRTSIADPPPSDSDAERNKEKQKKKKSKNKKQQHSDEQQQEEISKNDNNNNNDNDNDDDNNADSNNKDKPHNNDNNNNNNNDKQKSNGQSKEQERHSTIAVVAPDTTGHEDYRFTYVPTPLKPTNSSSDSKHSGTKNKWFPNALTFKSAVHYDNFNRHKGNASILLFYQYKSPKTWTNEELHSIIKYLQAIFTNRPNLGGRIRVAPEGLNCTLSAGDWFRDDNENMDETNNKNTSFFTTKVLRSSAAETLRHFTFDLQYYDSDLFAKTDFKFHDNLEGDRHFKDLKILPVQELVFYDLTEKEAPLEKTGIHLEPKDFHAMLKGIQPTNRMVDSSNEQDSKSSSVAETVVIDVRNHYEAAIGRFDGQQHQGQQTTDSKPAVYVDPKMRKSTDFKGWLAKEETKESLRGKNVMLYCTGGVRCERASAYLNNLMGDEVRGVYQLQGGIERYMKEIPSEDSCWRGKNFVFDKREAVSATNLNGDGGVITQNVSTKDKNITDSKKKKCKKTNHDYDNDNHVESSHGSTTTTCVVCQCPWDRYIGKRKCTTCGVPVLMCHKCMSSTTNTSAGSKKKKQQTTDKTLPTGDDPSITPSSLMIRCPLCVEEHVTVPATEVQYTNNGIGISAAEEAKSAPTVLKWGGGHAATKKAERRLKRRQCRFGSECTRTDCIFLHP